VGVADPVPGMPTDKSHLCFNSGHSAIVISGIRGRIFWFKFEKLDKKYYVPDIPRFTKDDARRTIEKRLKVPITETVLFEEIWKRTTNFDMVSLEEGLFEHWHCGRMVIIGDAAHKVR
jgi:2-polyprenyl-6-methoxyphenol hydroxylase-like FAD-dependent oxidoreductase